MTVVATRELTEIYGTDIDLFSRESLADPAADYHQLQDIGPLAYMRRYDLWAATRYSAVQRILTNPDVFCSSQGIGMNETLNTAWKDFAPTQDGAAHALARHVHLGHEVDVPFLVDAEAGLLSVDLDVAGAQDDLGGGG